MSAKQLIDYLNIFEPVPVADEAVVLQAFSLQTFNESDVLSEAQTVNRNLYFVVDGVLKIVQYTGDGKPVVYYLVKENHFCSILDSFTHQTPAVEEIQAACPVTVLAISRPQLLKLYQQLPHLEPLISHITQNTLLEKIKLRNSYLGKNAAARYQHFIEKQGDLMLRVPLNDIASYLGITQQSLSRIRRQQS